MSAFGAEEIRQLGECQKACNEARADGFRAGQMVGLGEALQYAPISSKVEKRILDALTRCRAEQALLEEAKCPRCGEPESGLFSGSSCDACGWKNLNPEPADA